MRVVLASLWDRLDATTGRSSPCCKCSAVPAAFVSEELHIKLCTICFEAAIPCPDLDSFHEHESGQAFVCDMCDELSNPSNNPWNPCRPVRDSDYLYTRWTALSAAWPGAPAQLCTVCDRCIDIMKEVATATASEQDDRG